MFFLLDDFENLVKDMLDRYSTDVFPDLDWEKVKQILGKNNISLDRVSGGFARMFFNMMLDRITEIKQSNPSPGFYGNGQKMYVNNITVQNDPLLDVSTITVDFCAPGDHLDYLVGFGRLLGGWLYKDIQYQINDGVMTIKQKGENK